MKRFLAAILIAAPVFLPCLALAQEAPASVIPEPAQEMADKTSNIVPIYIFASQSGEVVGITLVAPNLAVGCAVLPGTPIGSESSADAPPDAACFLWDSSTNRVALVTESGAGVGQRTFAGLMYDVGTGLNYAGDRYYDSLAGRFLSEDPLFLSIGDKKQMGTFWIKWVNRTALPKPAITRPKTELSN